MARILIADPDPSIRRTLAEALKGRGRSFDEAADAGRVLEILRGAEIDLVLADVDILEAEPDWPAALRMVRPGLGVVAMVGIGEDAERWMRKGALAAISKPFNLADLKRVVEGSLRGPEEKSGPRTGPIRKAAWTAAAALLAGGAGWFIHQRSLRPPPPPAQYRIPYANLSGIALGPGSLWTCDWFNQAVHRHLPDADLTLEASVSSETWRPTALAWDGKNLWTYSSWDRKMSRRHNDGKFSVLEETGLPEQIEPSSLSASGEGSFWFCDRASRKLGRFEIRNGKARLLDSATSPGSDPSGICQTAESARTLDGEARLLYRHGKDPGFAPAGTFELPVEMRREKLSSLACDEDFFWIGAPEIQKIFRVGRESLRPAARRP